MLGRTTNAIGLEARKLGLVKKRDKIVDLTGTKSGKLTVLGMSNKKDKHGRPLWDCICDCQLSKAQEEREHIYMYYTMS